MNDLRAELDEIEEEEDDIARQRRQDWYNEQIGLGRMKVHTN